MITIVDVGCRYGVFPMFKHCYEKFDYIGIDADEKEITRLGFKYKGRNIRFENVFLGSENKTVEFRVSEHKGYSSSKVINTDSLWFGLIRDNEKTIDEIKTIQSIKSGDWIAVNVKNKMILKLDIEGGELDLLCGLREKHFNKIEAVVAEASFESPYDTDSNFASISNRLSSNGFWLASMHVETERLSKLSEEKDAVPVCSTVVFLKNKYKPMNNNRAEGLGTMCEVLYALGLESLLVEFCKRLCFEGLKDLPIFDDLKFTIGHKFNRLKKEPHLTFGELNIQFKQMFGDNLPPLSDFYESEFFNPL